MRAPFGDLLAFRADRLAFLTRLARERGDVSTFRIGPYRVWQLAHPDLVRGVLVTHAARFRKGPVLQRARIVLGDGLLTAEGAHHRRHRRLLQPAFHPQRVHEYATTMVDRAERTTRTWQPGKAVDVHAQAVRMTLATAGATLLGTDVEADVDLVQSAIDDLLSAYRLAFVPFGWRLQHLPVGPPRRLRRGRRALHGLVDRAIADRRTRREDRGDLLSTLVLADEQDRLTDDEIREEALTLLLAGHETTANALAFALHLLASDPALQDRVHEEVDGVLAGRPPTADDRERLPVCRGVFAEALRLFPPSWAMGRQCIEDHPLDGHTIPVGDLVVLPQWVVHQDPRWWEDPTRCDPDRWTADAPTRRPRFAYFPFGGGIRQCIGEGFAWTEGVLALASILRQWRLGPVTERPLALEPLITLRPRNGVWLRPRLRDA
ncbi:cytochrome P450 [Egicoccus sp. AB-alg2]|uniref:cytochrome P450 n=1 Tax=Egicoccus sp. AB-alg2 TaxID=3242693 RepID=UPI00359E3AD7